MKKPLIIIIFAVIFAAVYAGCAKEKPTEVNIVVTVVVPPAGTDTPPGTLTVTPTITPTRTHTATASPTATATGTAIVPGVQYTGSFSDTFYSQLGNTNGYIVAPYSESFVPLSEGWVIYGDRMSNMIRTINVLTGQEEPAVQLNASPSQMGYDYTSGILYTGLSSSTFIAKVAMNTGAVTYIPVVSPVKYLEVSSSGKIYATHERVTSSPSDVLTITDGNAAAVLKTHYGGYYEGPILLNESLNQVFVYDYNLFRYAIDPGTSDITTLDSWSNIWMNANMMDISPDCLHVATRDQSTTYITDFNPVNLSVKYGSFITLSTPQKVAYSPDGTRIAIWDGAKIYLFNTAYHSQDYYYDVPYPIRNTGKQVAYSKGGKLIIVMMAGGSDIYAGVKLFWMSYDSGGLLNICGIN